MATKAKRHVHKYHKVSLSYADVWACALPDCNHYMPKHMEATLPGKYSFCWQCGEKFLLSPETMNLDKPKCLTCLYGLVESPSAEPDAPMSEALKHLLEKLEV
jgi:hypothetical protein